MKRKRPEQALSLIHIFPVWIQIRNHMIFLIRSGHLRPGDTLPTVRELAIQLGVNYNTIHKAVSYTHLFEILELSYRKRIRRFVREGENKGCSW